MAKEVEATFQKVFSETSSTESVRLIPWCNLHHHQSWHNSHILHEWGTDYHCVMKSRCTIAATTSPRAQGPTSPSLYWAALHMSNWDSTSSYCSHVRYSPYQHSPSQAWSLIQVHHQSPVHKKWDCSPQWCTWQLTWQEGPCWNCRGQCQQWTHVLHRAKSSHPKHHWRCPTIDTVASGSTEEHDSGDNTNHFGDTVYPR